MSTYMICWTIRIIFNLCGIVTKGIWLPFEMFFPLIIAFQWQIALNAWCECTSSIQENSLNARLICPVVCSHSFWFCLASSCALASQFNYNSDAESSQIKIAAIPATTFQTCHGSKGTGYQMHQLLSRIGWILEPWGCSPRRLLSLLSSKSKLRGFCWFKQHPISISGSAPCCVCWDSSLTLFCAPRYVDVRLYTESTPQNQHMSTACEK